MLGISPTTLDGARRRAQTRPVHQTTGGDGGGGRLASFEDSVQTLAGRDLDDGAVVQPLFWRRQPLAHRRQHDMLDGPLQRRLASVARVVPGRVQVHTRLDSVEAGQFSSDASKARLLRGPVDLHRWSVSSMAGVVVRPRRPRSRIAERTWVASPGAARTTAGSTT